MRLPRFCIQIILCALLAIPSFCQAMTIQTSGEYTIGDGETMAAGMDHARNSAIRQAAEQAGALVRSYTTVRNMALEEDVIEVVATMPCVLPPCQHSEI